MIPQVRDRHASPLLAMLTSAPRVLRLADLPTRVERATWLDGSAREVWIKRDDCSSTVYGGGKVRKLEWTLANPPYDGPEAITSMGGIGSNHLVALALFLRELDRRLHAIVFPQPHSETVLDSLAVMASLGTTFWYVRGRWQLPAPWLAFHLRRQRALGCYMTPGGSTPLGGFGFVAAGLELAAQIAAGEVPRPATLFVTGGSGGACSGLVLGLALGRVRTHVHIVSAVEPVLFNRALMQLKLLATYRLLRRHGLEGPRSLQRCLAAANVTWGIDHGQVGDGYGSATPATHEVRRLAAANDIHLDHTYTAKCVAGMLSSDARGPVVFWHTHAATNLKPHICPDWRSRLPEALARHIATIGRVGD